MKSSVTKSLMTNLPRVLAAGLLVLSPFLVFAEPGESTGSFADLRSQIYAVERGSEDTAVLVDYLIEQTLTADAVPDSLKPELFKNISGFNETFGIVTYERASKMLIAFPYREVRPLSSLVEKAVSRDSDSVKRVRRLFALAEHSALFAEEGNVAGLVALYNELNDAIEISVVEQQLVPALKKLAANAQHAETPFVVLNYLARLESLQKREDIKQLVNQLVVRIAQLIEQRPSVLEINWPFDSKKVLALIVAQGQENTKIGKPISELYSWRVLDLVKRDKAEAAEDYFDRVLTFRPDPNEQNDELRRQIVRSAKGDAVSEFKQKRLAELKKEGKLSFLMKAKLFFGGSYGKSLPTALLLTIIVSGGLVIAVYLWGKLAPMLAKAKRRPAVIPGMSTLKQRSGEQRKGYERELSGLDEYSKLLAVFDLEDTATEDDIKRAYRQKMKEHHPDSSVEKAPELVEVFREYKKVHDRLMEMRRSMFGR